MKRAAIVFAAFVLISAFVGILKGECQTALDLMFTNKVVTFTNLQGDLFLSAELVEADATQVVFRTNDIFGAEKLTNLSTATLQSLGIPVSRLGMAQELEVQKEQAASEQRAMLKQEQDALNDPTNLLGLKITSVISKNYSQIYGWLQFCNATLDGGLSGTFFIAKLPASAQEYLDRRAALSDSIAKLNNQIDSATAQIANTSANLRQAQYQVNRANATMPVAGITGDPGTDQASENIVASMQNQNALNQEKIHESQDSLDDLKNKVEDWKNQLTDEQKELRDLNDQEQSQLSFFVLKSHYTYNRFPILICAPQQNKQSVQFH